MLADFWSPSPLSTAHHLPFSAPSQLFRTPVSSGLSDMSEIFERLDWAPILVPTPNHNSWQPACFLYHPSPTMRSKRWYHASLLRCYFITQSRPPRGPRRLRSHCMRFLLNSRSIAPRSGYCLLCLSLSQRSSVVFPFAFLSAPSTVPNSTCWLLLLHRRSPHQSRISLRLQRPALGQPVLGRHVGRHILLLQYSHLRQGRLCCQKQGLPHWN